MPERIHLLTAVKQISNLIKYNANKSVISNRFKYHVVYKVKMKQRRLTAARRELPGFLILGAPRAGTTSLFYYLQQHPQVKTGILKEIYYFCYNYHKGELWYRSHFPLEKYVADNDVIGEATPNYLVNPHAPRRIYSLLPSAKLIVLLRNPKERAISEYYFSVRHGEEKLSLMEALLAEEDRVTAEWKKMVEDEFYFSKIHHFFAYKHRSVYADQLERYLKYFDRSQLHIINSKDLTDKPQTVLQSIAEYLEINSDFSFLDFSIKKNVASYQREIPANSNDYLDEYFYEHNQRLYELIGRDLGW